MLLQHANGGAGIWRLDADGNVVSWKRIEWSPMTGLTLHSLSDNEILVEVGSGLLGIWTLREEADTGVPIAWRTVGTPLPAGRRAR